MRFACLALLLPVAAGGLSYAAESEEFPYLAIIDADTAQVRCGPGRDYYPTLKLHRGDEVEVYRHDPGGWLAIRPPSDSFSWVRSRDLKSRDGGLAVAVRDGVQVRVGSHFSRVRDVIQVRLDKGEAVDVLEPEPNDDDQWTRVAAPAGEFRWVSSRDIRPIRRDDVARSDRRGRVNLLLDEQERRADDRHDDDRRDDDYRDDERDDYTVRSRHDRRSDDYERDDRDRDAYARDGDRRDRGATRADYEEPVDDERVAIEQAGYEETRHARRGDSGGRPSWSDRRDGPPRIRLATRTDRPGISAGGVSSFDEELADIDLQLSEMAAEPPTRWSFEEIKLRSEDLDEAAETAVERGRSRELQKRIARLEDVRRRYAAQQPGGAPGPAARIAAGSPPIPRDYTLRGATPASGTAAHRGPAAYVPPRAAATAPPAAGRTDFDGTGILRPVISRRPDAPHYALVDDNANVVSFLTPGPGMNLQPYLGQRIGVYGTRGYIAEMKKPHVMVKRVAPLVMAGRPARFR